MQILNKHSNLLSASVIGNLSITDTGEIPLHLSRKSKCLLAFFLLNTGKLFSREYIASLFWSENSLMKSRASLRQSLREIRISINEDILNYFNLDGLEVGILKPICKCDIFDILQKIDDNIIDPLLLNHKFINEQLFAGYDDIDPSFNAWLQGFRQNIYNDILEKLQKILNANAEFNNLKLIKNTSLALIQLDETHEGAIRALMSAYYFEGNISAALKAYKNLWQNLEDEYDVEPSKETQELVVQIKVNSLNLPQKTPTNQSNTLILSNTQPKKQYPLILIEPVVFSNSLEREQHLLFNFKQEFSTNLSRFREWRVMTKPDESQIPEIHRGDQQQKIDLIDYRINLSCSKFQDAIFIIMILLDNKTNLTLWSEKFTFNLTKWFEIQRDIIVKIAISLRLYISIERIENSFLKNLEHTQLIENWLEGQNYFNSYSSANWDKAEVVFQKIISQEASYSPALSGLVQLRNSRHLVYAGVLRQRKLTEEALYYARMAMQTDPLDSRAHLSLAWSFAMSGLFEQAYPYFISAHKLNENDTWTLSSVCQGLAFLSHHEEALDIETKLLNFTTLLSRTQWAYLVGTRFLRGDYEGCIFAGKMASEQIINLPAWLAAALALSGKKHEAELEINKFYSLARQKWQLDTKPSPKEISVWFLQNFPIKSLHEWSSLRDGFHLAGGEYCSYEECFPNAALNI